MRTNLALILSLLLALPVAAQMGGPPSAPKAPAAGTPMPRFETLVIRYVSVAYAASLTVQLTPGGAPRCTTRQSTIQPKALLYTCTATIVRGTPVTLTAKRQHGPLGYMPTKDKGWLGDCTGTVGEKCALMMDRARDVWIEVTPDKFK